MPKEISIHPTQHIHPTFRSKAFLPPYMRDGKAFNCGHFGTNLSPVALLVHELRSFSQWPPARKSPFFLRYTHITPIFWGQTDPTKWDLKSPIFWITLAFRYVAAWRAVFRPPGRILARKSVFCYRTPDFVNGPFVTLDDIFDLAPSDRFLVAVRPLGGPFSGHRAGFLPENPFFAIGPQISSMARF